MSFLYPEHRVMVFGDQDVANLINGRIHSFGYDVIQLQSLHLVSENLHRNDAGLVILDSHHPAFSMEGLLQLLDEYPEAGNSPLLLLAESEDPALSDKIVDFDHLQVIDKKDYEGFEACIDHHLGSSLVLKFWGVRGSTPTPGEATIRYGGNTTCVQLASPDIDEAVILDCGTGIRYLGNEIESKMNNRADGHLFITHSHWDHIQGLPFFKPFYSGENHFRIHMPEQFRGRTREILSGQMTTSFFPVSLDVFSADIEYITQDEKLSEYDGFSVEYMIANHPAKTAIYKFHLGDKSIIFAPDNELNREPSPLRFIDRFEEFVQGCDLLIHDAQYNARNYEENVGRGHSAWEYVVEVAKRCNVKRLVLTHHDPDSTDGHLAEIDRKLRLYRKNPFLDIRLAREGALVKIPVRDSNEVQALR